jgi:ppGpp synthetase/RelA/SpoT-type nucleotidyltranferase
MNIELEALRSDYASAQSWLDGVVLYGLRNLLADACGRFHKQYPEISAPKAPECRVKTFAKIIDKVERKKRQKNREWQHQKIYYTNTDGRVTAIVNDLVGGKVVCATPADVEKLAAVLKSWGNRLFDIEEEAVVNPKTGYRAYHIDARIRVEREDHTLLFPVEIQIKTLLQDAWANFDHDEIYKPTDELPEVSKAISRKLADVLAALDDIGQIIRDEKFKKLPAQKIDDEETLVTHRTLNYIVDQVFQETLNEIELQKSVEQLKAFGYISIASVGDLLRDDQLINEIEVAKASLRISGTTTPYEILYYGPLAAKEGRSGVISELRRVYALTEISCDGCQAPITTYDKEFKEKKTDLDELYFCQQCRETKLRQCALCDKFTETETCKDCQAKDASSEIV